MRCEFYLVGRKRTERAPPLRNTAGLFVLAQYYAAESEGELQEEFGLHALASTWRLHGRPDEKEAFVTYCLLVPTAGIEPAPF